MLSIRGGYRGGFVSHFGQLYSILENKCPLDVKNINKIQVGKHKIPNEIFKIKSFSFEKYTGL